MFGRSVYHHLQVTAAAPGADPGYRQWFASKSAEVTSDPVLEYFRESRDLILKERQVLVQRRIFGTGSLSVSASLYAEGRVTRSEPWYRRSPRLLCHDATGPVMRPIRRWRHRLGLTARRRHQSLRLRLDQWRTRWRQRKVVPTVRQFYLDDPEGLDRPAVDLVRTYLDRLEAIVAEAEARFPAVVAQRQAMTDVPMPRLPINRRHSARQRESLVASAVGAVLRAEGHVLRDAYRPRQGQGRSPDWVMTLDGEPTALEVTRLLPRAHVQKAEDLVIHIESRVRTMLAGDISGIGGQVLLGLDYFATAVAGPQGSDLLAHAHRLATDVRAVLVRLRPALPDFADVPSSLPWVARANLTVVPGLHDGFYIVQRPDEAQQPDLDDWVAGTITAKGDQHGGYAERAILAIDAEFPDADDLRAAFGRSPVPVPWWRVYLVHGSDATLVYTALEALSAKIR